MRECGWEGFLQKIKVFCSRNDINMLDLDCLYKIGRSREQTTVEHHYHFDVFNESFNSDDICKLAKKFYLEDFIDQDIITL